MTRFSRCCSRGNSALQLPRLGCCGCIGNTLDPPRVPRAAEILVFIRILRNGADRAFHAALERLYEALSRWVSHPLVTLTAPLKVCGCRSIARARGTGAGGIKVGATLIGGKPAPVSR